MASSPTSPALPETMQAVTCVAGGAMAVQTLPVPTVPPGGVLVRVAACGVCGTDIKKVTHDLAAPGAVLGHETAGVVAAVGGEGTGFGPGDRVAIYHHRVDPDGWYAQRGLPAQDPSFRETGALASEPAAGGGYSEYVLCTPTLVARGGLVRVPWDVPLERAIFLEPINTCVKAVRALSIQDRDVVLVAGAGSIGLMLAQVARRHGARVVISEPDATRRARAQDLGIDLVLAPDATHVERRCRDLTGGRGADHALLATEAEAAVETALSATRPGATIVVFAHTRRGHRGSVDLGRVCAEEKILRGVYSANPACDAEAEEIVFRDGAWLDALITHRHPLVETAAAIQRAASAAGDVGKVVVIQEHP